MKRKWRVTKQVDDWWNGDTVTVFIVSNGDIDFRCLSGCDADWLCDKLNEVKAET